MLNKLFNYFKRDIEGTEETEETSEALSSLTFEIMKDGTINILCEWPDFDDKNSRHIQNIAKYYAMCVYGLNSGMLEKDILDTLKNHDESNSFNKLFVHNVLIELITLQKMTNKNNVDLDRPIISPLEVFNMQKELP